MSQTGFKRWLQAVWVLALMAAWPLGAGAADPTPAPPPLTQNFAIEEGGGAFGLSYPAGWVHGEKNGAITLGNTQAALDNIDGEAVPRQLTVVIWPISANVASAYGVWPSPKRYQEVVNSLMTKGNHPAYSQGPADITIGDRPAARITVQNSGEGHDMLLLFLNTGPDNVSAVIAAMPAGEMPQLEPTILAIAGALSYSATASAPPAAPTNAPPVVQGSATPDAKTQAWQKFFSDDKKFTFEYPQGWVLGPQRGPVVTLGNTQAALDDAKDEGVRGELVIGFLPTSADVALALGGPSDAKTHQEVLKSVLAQTGQPVWTRPPTEITVGNKPATWMMAQQDGRDMLLFIVDSGPNNVSSVMAGAAGGGMPEFESTVLAIVASMAYTGTASSSE